MQNQLGDAAGEGLKEDEAEAAFVDSFFLPGGILDPEADKGGCGGNTGGDGDDDVVADIVQPERSPFSTPLRKPAASPSSATSSGGTGSMNRALNVPALSSVFGSANPWDTNTATAAAAAADGTVAAAATTQQPVLMTTEDPTATACTPSRSSEEVALSAAAAMAATAAAPGTRGNRNSIFFEPIGTSATGSNTVADPFDSSRSAMPLSPPMLRTTLGMSPPIGSTAGIIATGATAASAALPLPPPISLPPPGFDFSSPAFVGDGSSGKATRSVSLGGTASKQAAETVSDQPLSALGKKGPSTTVFDFGGTAVSGMPLTSPTSRFSPSTSSVGSGGSGAGRTARGATAVAMSNSAPPPPPPLPVPLSSSALGTKKSYATVAYEAKKKKAKTPSSSSPMSPSGGGTPGRTTLNKRMSQPNAAAGAFSPSSGQHHRSQFPEENASSPRKAGKKKNKVKHPAGAAEAAACGSIGDKNSKTRDEKNASASKTSQKKLERSDDGWTRPRKHNQADERDDDDKESQNSFASGTGSKASAGHQATNARPSSSTGAKQKYRESVASGQDISGSTSNKAKSAGNRQKESDSLAAKDSSDRTDDSPESSQQQSSPSVFDALSRIFQMAMAVLQAILPLARGSLMGVAYFFAAAAKMLILLALGLANTFRYAVEEVEHVDGAFLCYLVLYLVPHVCDVLMTCFSLPHYAPHFISALSIYHLCSESSSSALSPSSSTATSSSSSSAPSSPRRGGKRPPSSRSSGSSSSHQYSYYYYSSDSKEQELCRLILWWCRSLLPFNLILEGFTEPNLSFMLLHDWTRLLLAFVLSLVRANLILSPVAWLSWSLQVFIIVYLPPSFFNGCFLLMTGLASVRLCTVLQQLDIIDEASGEGERGGGGAPGNSGTTNGKHHKD